MKSVLAVLAFGVPTAATSSTTNPLGKVLELMDSLTAKVVQEGEAEAKAYKEYFAWCDDTARNKGFEIKTAQTKKGKLEAAIGKAAADAEAATEKIGKLVKSIQADEDDLRKATSLREKEAADFSAKQAELEDIVNTLDRAIGILEREMSKNPASFVQVNPAVDGIIKSLSVIADAAAFSSADKRKLLALVQSTTEADDESFGAPAADSYNSHSGGILDILEDLKSKSDEQLSEVRKSEATAKNNYQMLKQSLDDQIAADNKDLEDEKSTKSASVEAKAVAEGDLANTVKDLQDGQETLQTTKDTCMQTAADHEASMKSRDEELNAIATAKKVLMGTASGAESQTYSMLQTGEGKMGSRLQTHADLAAREEVVTMLKRLAEKHRSAALAQLTSRVTSVLRLGRAFGGEPFDKVKGLIKGMIQKLQKQAAEEASEKAYCDEQMAKTKAKKDELDEDLSKLTSKVDKALAKSVDLKADVKELQEELSALAKEQAEMDNIRQDERAAFKQAKADLELGLAGVQKALSVLRDYYGSASAAAMIQSGTESDQPAMPEAHSKAGGAGQSIIGILEVVESDFAKNLAKATSEEDDSEANYQTTTQENKKTRTLKEQDVKYNTQEFKSLDKEIASLTGDRDTTNAELDAVLEYYDKIKDRCIAKPETYEDRKARREAEISGLREALAVLQDQTAFVQHKKGSRSHFLGMREG
eukprot:CAMPEP_0197879552 /NCGR_PEP_ID=MMETSP1439-20131203/7602_1 /TAXON_ID=66791 /ORGANISM="Gonyaulax spinifera, Strain CCMP409" /LENGTH=703 /DNA_ID=CAMNT_0043499061 /DNA_START=51 /DNA_END=2162 /DNA_ORIENTATION=+